MFTNVYQPLNLQLDTVSVGCQGQFMFHESDFSTIDLQSNIKYWSWHRQITDGARTDIFSVKYNFLL